VKGRHLTVEVNGGFEDLNAEGCAGALAEAHFEVQERAGVEEVQHLAMAFFGGAVGEDCVIK